MEDYNAATQDGGKAVSNFLLHGLRIKNDLDEDIIIKGINFELYMIYREKPRSYEPQIKMGGQYRWN